MTTLHTLKNRFFKSTGLLQCLLLTITIISLASCAKEDDRFYFDAEAQKLKDEETIRKYFRDNNVDTTAVVRSNSGLYYLEVIKGEGAPIAFNDSISVHYVGKYTDNYIFDSSYNRGKLYNFRVKPGTLTEAGVIEGWVEGLQKMREGGEGLLFIPSHLAYGPYPSRGGIPPNAVLVFDIEVKKKH